MIESLPIKDPIYGEFIHLDHECLKTAESPALCEISVSGTNGIHFVDKCGARKIAQWLTDWADAIEENEKPEPSSES